MKMKDLITMDNYDGNSDCFILGCGSVDEYLMTSNHCELCQRQFILRTMPRIRLELRVCDICERRNKITVFLLFICLIFLGGLVLYLNS